MFFLFVKQNFYINVHPRIPFVPADVSSVPALPSNQEARLPQENAVAKERHDGDRAPLILRLRSTMRGEDQNCPAVWGKDDAAHDVPGVPRDVSLCFRAR